MSDILTVQPFLGYSAPAPDSDISKLYPFAHFTWQAARFILMLLHVLGESQMAAGSAFSSGFTVQKNRPKNGPKFQYFILLAEMEKRAIPLNPFAQALGVTPPVVKGSKGDFPLEKIDQALDLLNNWTGPISNRRSGPLGPARKTENLQPVTRQMLLTGESV